jgi:hypothetical protein
MEWALTFARPWYAKKAVELRDWAAVGSGLSKATILANTLAEFDANHATNESIAEPEDKIGTVVDAFMS